MDRRLFISIFAATVACTGSNSDGDDGAGSTSTTAGDELATTLPLTATFGDSAGSGGSGTAGASTGGSSGSPTTGATSSGRDTSTSGNDTTTGDTTGAATYEIEWCRLQYPPMVSVAPMETFGVFGRFYVSGVTDLSGVNDPDPAIVAEVGYGADGSDPAVDPWTWVPAGPNAAYGPGAPLYEANNDEYNGDLTIDGAGTYDYAFRVSGDFGATWVYCDLDDLLTGGYTPDQAGDAVVG